MNSDSITSEPQLDLDDTFSSDSNSIEVTAVTNDASLRVVSTLQPDETFFIAKKDRKKDFLYLFGGFYQERSENFFGALALSGILAFEGKSAQLVQSKNLRKSISIKEMFKNLKVTSNFIKVYKNLDSQTFTVTVPIFSFTSKVMAQRLLELMCNVGPESGNTAPSADFPSLSTLPAEGFKLTGWDQAVSPFVRPADANALAGAGAEMFFQPMGGTGCIVALNLTIKKAEIEFITNKGFLQSTPLDLFGPIQEWVSSYFGRLYKSPEFSIPLSKIAAETKGKGEPRLNEDNILIDDHGRAFSFDVGENTDQIHKFEESVSNAYKTEDGGFSSVGVDKKRLPKSMPVLLDWVNLKFSYTSNEGKLLVKGLDRSMPASKAHYVRFLEEKIGSDTGQNFLTQSSALSTYLGTGVLDSKNLMAEVASKGRIRDEYVGLQDISLYEIYNYSKSGLTAGGSPDSPGYYCGLVVDVLKRLEERLIADPENAFTEYSTLTVLGLLAYIKMFNRTASRFYAARSEDESDRSIYINQGANPDYKGEELPYVADGIGKLPHQVKVENLLRDRPANAALPVDTGGGKSMIAITDFLKAMKSSTGPFLILCPSHLVAQYTKEIVYFTAGSVNAIPVTGYTIRRHGFSRLLEMIKSAPRNTLIISDFLVLVLKAYRIGYGVSGVNIYPVVEFLRQFRVQQVFIDESHKLKNGTTRQQAVHRLVADIPYKRIASGTLVYNVLTDLVKQIALLDPTIFGTEDDFIKNYALETRGGKVISWKPGAELAIKYAMKGNLVLAEAKKKEWAAILPRPRERFHRVELTNNQRAVYDAVLNEAIEKIRDEATRNESLRLAISGKSLDDDGNEIDSDVDVDKILKPYLARLEMFLTAPAHDALGNQLLTDHVDRQSPKANKIVELVKQHISQGMKGKFIVFTNYTASVDAIYEAFGDMKDMVIPYSAGTKDEDLAEFEFNDSKRVLIGVEDSLNTGGNLQFAQCLFRVDTVWTPGVLEQGNARIGRPNIKVRENRTEIYYEWIVCDRTIDVSKISYLVAKTISKAKFDEAGNPRFDELETPNLFPMTLDTLRVMPTFDVDMKEYFDKYQVYKQAVFAEYDEYRKANQTTLFNEDGSIKMEKMVRGETPADSALLKRVPYVPGTELYKASELGLVRYDAFVRKDIADTDDDAEDDQDDVVSSELADERAQTMGLVVHTDRGEGIITRVGRVFIGIELNSGEKIRVRKLAAFIVTRAETSDKDLRKEILLKNPFVKKQIEVDVLETKLTPRKQKEAEALLEKEAARKRSVVFDLEVTVVNDYLGLRLLNMDDDLAAQTAAGFNFKYSPAYVSAAIPTAAHYLKFFHKLKEAGFSIDKNNSTKCKHTYDSLISRSKKQVLSLIGLASDLDIRNFYRQEFKPNPDRLKVDPYPLVKDNILYLAMPLRGHPSTTDALQKVRVPGMKWVKHAESSELIAFTPSKEKVLRALAKFEQSGITIANRETLIKQIKKLRIARDKS